MNQNGLLTEVYSIEPNKMDLYLDGEEQNMECVSDDACSEDELKLNTSGTKTYLSPSVKAKLEEDAQSETQVMTKRGRGRPKKGESIAKKPNVPQSVVPLFSGRVRRKSSLGLKKVLESIRGVRQDKDDIDDVTNNAGDDKPKEFNNSRGGGDFGNNKAVLNIAPELNEEDEDEQSVETDQVIRSEEIKFEQEDRKQDDRESDQDESLGERIEEEDMLDSLSEEEDFNDSHDDDQDSSGVEDEDIQLQLMQQMQEESEEWDSSQRQIVEEPAVEKKKYVIPKDTLNFLKNVKKAKKKEKVPVTIKTIESPSDIAKKVLDEILDEVDGKKHFLITQVRRGSYALPKNMSSLAKFAMAKKRKKGEPSERSVLFKYSQHEEKGWYICPRENCDFRSRHSKNVYTHEKRHNGNYPYMCSLCGKRFILKKNYRIHQDAHQDLRPYHCQDCGKSFRNQSNLQRHKLVHTGEKPFQCDVETCGVAFKDKINLKKHIALVHEGQRPYECTYPGCAYVAYDKHALDKHKIKHQDLQDRPSEKCTICDKILYGARSLQSHMLIHSGESYECPFCEYTTVFKQALQAHSMRKHYMDLEGNHVERKYKCKQCDFATFWEHDLRFHVTKHGAYKPFKCPICDYSTVLKGSLQKHMRLHTGEQPYACNVCGKAYTNQSGLARHKRSHTGEKPHKCDICGKKYADMKTLRNHRYSHLNLKPFMCPLCNYNCTKKDVLLTHYKRVHGDGNIPDNIRPKPFQRVIMRVTSGQTADEIISNIAPPGKGERQFLVMGGESGGVEQESQEEKFLVIHEDEAHALSMIQDSQALHNEALSSESVFRIIQTGDGQATVDSLNKNLDLLGDENRKVMKIATAPKNPQREKYFQRIQVNQPTTPQHHQVQVQQTGQQLHVGRFPNLEGLGTNFVLVPSGDNSVLQTLQLEPKSDLIAIPASQSAISDIVNEALNVQNFGLGPSTVEMSSALETVLQQSKASSEHLAGGGTELHMTHPILQSQLKRDPDTLSMMRNMGPVTTESAASLGHGQQQNTVFIQVQGGNSEVESMGPDLVSAPTILHSDLQAELMVKTEGTSSLTSEIQKLQENLAVTGSSQLEFVRAAGEHMGDNEGHIDISQHLLADENNEKFVLHLPEGHDLNPKDGALEIAGIESGEYVIAYLQSEGHLTDKNNLPLGDSIQLSDRRFAALDSETQSKLMASDNQGYFEGQNDVAMSFRTENQDQLGSSGGSNSIVTFTAETQAVGDEDNSEQNQFDMTGQNVVTFESNEKISEHIQTEGQSHSVRSSLSFTADHQVQIMSDDALHMTGSEIATVEGGSHHDVEEEDKIDIAQLEKQISDMSEEMLIQSPQQQGT